jgi:hypothetical protein
MNIAKIGLRAISMLAVSLAPLEIFGAWRMRDHCSRYCFVPDLMKAILPSPYDSAAMGAVFLLFALLLWKWSNRYDNDEKTQDSTSTSSGRSVEKPHAKRQKRKRK